MQRITRCTILVAFFLVAWGSAYAQKEDYVWFFGDSLLLDFNSEPPVVLPIARSWTWGTSTSLSDSTGSLLFYMNHQQVFNSQHELVIRGINSELSNYQSTWILPSPEKSNEIFLLAIGPDNCPSPRPCFNSNLLVSSEDTVVLAFKNKIHHNNMCPKVAVTRHANGKDFWIVTHEKNTDRFIVFLLTTNGVEGPFEQTIGSIVGEIDYSYLGEMTFSPKGDFLVQVGLSGFIELLEFDRCTGLLSNANLLVPGQGPGITYERSYFGAEFSGSGDVLYITQSTSSATGFWGQLLQLGDCSKNCVKVELKNSKL